MGSCLDAKGSKGVGAIDFNRGTLDTGFFGVAGVEDSDRILMGFCPPRIHPQQHFREICGVNTASTRTNGDDGRGRIKLAIQESLDFHRTQQSFELI